MNDKVKKFMLYVGVIGSIISAIAYLIITYVIITGFEQTVNQDKQILFAVFGSFIGLIITFLLRTQGISFAEKEEKSVEVMTEYNELLNKTKTLKQLHTIKFFMIVQTIKDVFSKGISIAGSTFLIMYIFQEGNGDFSLLGLAFSNILMFTGFGFIALSKAYDKYIDEHIPVIKTLIIKLKEKLKIKDQDLVSEFMELFITNYGQTGPIQSEREKNAYLQQCEIQDTSTTSGGKQNFFISDSDLFVHLWSQSFYNCEFPFGT